MEPLTAAERTIVLRALFELAITESGFDDEPDREERADHESSVVIPMSRSSAPRIYATSRSTRFPDCRPIPRRG